MENLKKLNFTELNPSEMKQVKGGALLSVDASFLFGKEKAVVKISLDNVEGIIFDLDDNIGIV